MSFSRIYYFLLKISHYAFIQCFSYLIFFSSLICLFGYFKHSWFKSSLGINFLLCHNCWLHHKAVFFLVVFHSSVELAFFFFFFEVLVVNWFVLGDGHTETYGINQNQVMFYKFPNSEIFTSSKKCSLGTHDSALCSLRALISLGQLCFYLLLAWTILLLFTG